MEKEEFRAVVKHFHIDGKTPRKIKEKLDKVYRTSVPTFRTIYFYI